MYFYKVLKLNIKAGQSCRSGCRTPPPFPPLKVWTGPMASHSSHDTYFRIFQACTQIQSFGSSHPFANRKRGQMLLTSPPPHPKPHGRIGSDYFLVAFLQPQMHARTHMYSTILAWRKWAEGAGPSECLPPLHPPSTHPSFWLAG